MLQFELWFQDILKIENLMFSKSHLKNIAFTTKNDHKFDHIMKEEHLAFLELIKLDNIIIQKADKSNVVVIVDKNVYIEKMESILSDTFKFQEVKFDKINEELDYLLDEEKEIRKFLKELKDKNVINDSEFKFLNPCGSQPGVLYGLCKVHKESIGNSPLFHPILSDINTPSYKLANF